MGKERKQILAMGIIFAILVIFLFGWGIYNLIPRAYIQFEVAPSEVKAIIDNQSEKTIRKGDKIMVDPGDHVITLFRNEFDTSIEKINIKNGDTLEYYAALTPLSEKATVTVTNDKESEKVITRVGEDRQAVFSEFTAKAYPIMGVLPIRARLYTVSSCRSQRYPNNLLRLALCVDSSISGLEQDIYKDIRWRSYNPDDYEFIWTVTPNPN